MAAQDVSHSQLINDNSRKYFIFDIKQIFKSSIEASIGIMMKTSIIIVFVKLTVVGNVVSEHFVDSAFKADWLDI